MRQRHGDRQLCGGVPGAAVPSYGADGPGTTTVSGYSLSVTDSNSGLTSNGLAITLTKVGSDIVGSTTAG
ncbi:DUF5801 repeats-in-toxin domain-containing protein, partial [Aeromonas hydrophila]|uniref:DUF5801 repeats-in-toxin domain-containing protein n=1 Tax=Aeromonas hydrophila TaxID=644 RepID=UPI0005369800